MRLEDGHITQRELELMEQVATYEGQLADGQERIGRAETELEKERLLRDEIVRRMVEEEVAARIRKLQEEAKAKAKAELDEREEALREKEKSLAQKETEIEARRRRVDEDRKAMEESWAAKIRGIKDEMEKAVAKAINDYKAHADNVHNKLIESFVDTLKAIPAATEEQRKALLAAHAAVADEAVAAVVEAAQKKIETLQATARKSLALTGWLARQTFGRKSERVIIADEDKERMQTELLESKLLSDEDLAKLRKALAEHNRAKAAIEEKKEAEAKKGHGQSPIPDSVPVSSVRTIIPQEVIDNPGLYRKINEHKTATLLRHTSYSQSQVIREIYVLIDPLAHPELPEIVGGTLDEGEKPSVKYSNSVKVDTAVSKYADHIPLARQETISEREGCHIGRSSMVDFIDEIAEVYLKPLFPLLESEVMKSPHIAADGVPMKVVIQGEGRTAARYVTEIRSVDTGAVIFKSHINDKDDGEGKKKKGKSGRSKEVLRQHLKDWVGGALMCDAYSGYDWIPEEKKSVLCRCGAHERREFEESDKENHALAQYPLMLNQMIFGTEAYIKWAIPQGLLAKEDICTYRQTFAEPAWLMLKAWCVKTIPGLPDGSRLKQACNYLLRHYDELTNYLVIPEMPLDNNECERHIRKLVMTRKNSLFCQSEEALSRDTLYYSFFATCLVKGVNIRKWLEYVMDNFDSTPAEKLFMLLPQHWTDPSATVETSKTKNNHNF